MNNFNRSEIYQVHYSLSDQIEPPSISSSKKNADLNQKQEESIESSPSRSLKTIKNIHPKEPDSPKPSRASINYGRKVFIHNPVNIQHSINCNAKYSCKLISS